MRFLRKWLWPEVALRRTAQHAIDEAFWVSTAIASFRLFFALVLYLRPGGEIGSSLPLVFDGLLFIALATGIYFRSRVASVLALALFTGEFLYALFSGQPAGLFIAVLASLALFAGVRGTFAYHRFPKKPENLPSLAESFRSVKSPTDN